MTYFYGFTADEIVYADGFKLNVHRTAHVDECDCAFCRLQPPVKVRRLLRQPWEPKVA